jgi:hypothetical protein
VSASLEVDGDTGRAKGVTADFLETRIGRATLLDTLAVQDIGTAEAKHGLKRFPRDARFTVAQTPERDDHGPLTTWTPGNVG